MTTRRRVLQFAALSPLGSISFCAHATDFVWALDLESFEPIAHSLFGKLPLALSDRFQIVSSTQSLKQFDSRGRGIYQAENAAQVPIVIRDIFTTKVALLLEKPDYNPRTVATFQFVNAKVTELRTRISLHTYGDSRALNRVWALTESDGQVLYSYVNVKQHLGNAGD